MKIQVHTKQTNGLSMLSNDSTGIHHQKLASGPPNFFAHTVLDQQLEVYGHIERQYLLFPIYLLHPYL